MQGKKRTPGGLIGIAQQAFGAGQKMPIPGRELDMVPNSESGYVFPVDHWKRLERFLILSSGGGTYYTKAPTLTAQNGKAVIDCLHHDATRTIRTITAVSLQGRAYRNDAAIFSLALCAATGDSNAAAMAYEALPLVCRTATHLFQFNSAYNIFRKWGRARRRAISNWYNQKTADELAYQAIKYQSRDGWSHRILLRRAHPIPATPAHDALYKYIKDGTIKDADAIPHLVTVYEQAKAAQTEQGIVDLINREKLTWEFVPSQWLGSATVWDALLPNLPLTALLRNLARLTVHGLLAKGSQHSEYVGQRLTDQRALLHKRVHPMAILVAKKIYDQGQGEKGTLFWNPVGEISNALEAAYYLSFGSVKASGKRVFMGVDVSGSMSTKFAGKTPLTCAEGATAMAMITARVEPQSTLMAFSHTFVPLDINAETSLNSALAETRHVNFGGTDCSLPMIWAAQNRINADLFVVITDDETHSGFIHPAEALENYRQKMGIDAKMITVGMASNGFSIADPKDPGMLDVVGFDTGTPQVISNFANFGDPIPLDAVSTENSSINIDTDD